MPATTLEAPQGESVSVWPLVLRYRPGLNLADREQFFAFCQDNAPYQIERDAHGGIVVKMPTGGESGNRNKMTEYLESGVRLAILLDPLARRAWVYRPGVAVTLHDDPAILDGSPELPGFVLDVRAIFNAQL